MREASTLSQQNWLSQEYSVQPIESGLWGFKGEQWYSGVAERPLSLST